MSAKLAAREEVKLGVGRWREKGREDIHQSLPHSLVQKTRHSLLCKGFQRIRQFPRHNVQRGPGNRSVVFMDRHALVLVVLAPLLDVFEPVQSVRPARGGRAKRRIVDPHVVPEALPERGHGALFHVVQLAPLSLFNPSDGVEHEKTEDVQHVVIRDLAGLLVHPVDVVHPRDRLHSPFVIRRIQVELSDHDRGVGVPLVDSLACPLCKLVRLDQQAGDCRDSNHLRCESAKLPTSAA